MSRVRQRMTLAVAAGLLACVLPSVAQPDVREQHAAPKVHPRLKSPPGMVSGNVTCRVQDRAGNIWFTGGRGVYRFDGKSFTNFTTGDGLCDDNVNTIIEDKAGNIVFGTRRGICRYDGKSFLKCPEPGDLSVTCLLEDRDGNLWFGAMTGGVYRYDGKTLENVLNNHDHQFNQGDSYQLIMDIVQDRGGNLWFSSWNGGGVWRYDGKVFKNFLPSADYYLPKDGFVGDGRTLPAPPIGADYPSESDTITDDMIFSITEDSAGQLWFATRRHGACRYDPVSGTITSFREKEGFVSYGIYSILEDRNGNIWLTTDESGVWRYDGKTFRNFTTDDGLVNNSVFSALEDRDGNLWFGTRGLGLSRYDGASFTTMSE